MVVIAVDGDVGGTAVALVIVVVDGDVGGTAVALVIVVVDGGVLVEHIDPDDP